MILDEEPSDTENLFVNSVSMDYALLVDSFHVL